MKVSLKQIEAVLALPSHRRCEHFIKVVADWQVVWGLYHDGWALATTDQGTPVLPLWPAKEYAELCRGQEWASYEPRPIALGEFMDEWLPRLETDGVLPGIFFTPSSKGITPAVGEVRAMLRAELAKY